MAHKNIIATKFWDLYGYFYDGLLNLYPYQNLLNRVATKIDIDEKTVLLDLGCGTGNLAAELLNRNPNLSLVGVDWSGPMIRRAQNKTKKFKNAVLKQEKIELYLKDVERDHFTDVVMVNVVYTIADRKLLWSQIFHCLKPGGTLIFANPDKAGNNSILKEHLQHSTWFSLFRPRLIGIWVIDSIISLMGVAGSYQFTKQAVLYKELASHGFVVHEALTERCYGGDKDGIDIIVIASKPGVMV